MKVVSIVGARPQFIKAAAVSHVLRQRHKEILVHTGQHYDYEMSGVFFDGLDLPKPDVNIGVGSGTHGTQTAAMLDGIEKILLAHRPDYLLIYGDTNSTLAGAVAASKLSIPVAHVEAGLRSYNRGMPEEINRVVADHLSHLLFCPSEVAVQNLAQEGITQNVHVVGDVMLDILNWAKERIAKKQNSAMQRLGLIRQQYILATVHRSENTDEARHLKEIIQAFNAINETVVFPVHPRARKLMTEYGCKLKDNVLPLDPVGYLEMVELIGSARKVLTDSGGLQKEAFWMGVPCVTMRNETEWVETVEAGWNILVGCDTRKIVEAAHSFEPAKSRPQLYGDGRAAGKCVELLN